MSDNTKKLLNISFGLLIILLPYILAGGGSFTGFESLSPMYEVYFSSKVICSIIGIIIIRIEINN